MEYISREDATRRLDQSVCMYNGEPVWVTVNPMFPVNTIHVEPLVLTSSQYNKPDTIPRTRVHIMDEAFSIRLPCIGYVNHPRRLTCSYPYRYPRREQQQGLRNGVLSNVPDGIRTKDMYNMFMNIYPSTTSAFSSLTKGSAFRNKTTTDGPRYNATVAVHKMLAVGRAQTGQTPDMWTIYGPNHVKVLQRPVSETIKNMKHEWFDSEWTYTSNVAVDSRDLLIPVIDLIREVFGPVNIEGDMKV